MLPTVTLRSRFGWTRRTSDSSVDRHAADQPKRASQRFLLLADRRDGFLQVLEDPVAQLKERFASGGDSDPPPDPVEDRFAELLLEQQDLPADR